VDYTTTAAGGSVGMMGPDRDAPGVLGGAGAISGSGIWISSFGKRIVSQQYKVSNLQQHTVIYPVRLKGTILGGTAPSTRPSDFSMSRFHCSIHFSSFLSRDLTPVRPKSSHNHPVATPSMPSRIFLQLYGLKIGMSSPFNFSITRRNSCSVTPAGSNISGYRLEKVGAKSPSISQSRRTRMMRVLAYSGESTGT